MLPLIGAFKLAKGLLILAVALGVLHLVRGDPADTLTRWAGELHIDPEGRHFVRAVDRILSTARAKCRPSGSMCSSPAQRVSVSAGSPRTRCSTPSATARIRRPLASLNAPMSGSMSECLAYPAAPYHI